MVSSGGPGGARLHDEWADFQARRAEFLGTAEATIFDEPLVPIAKRFRDDYGSYWTRLRSSYRADKRTIRSHALRKVRRSDLAAVAKEGAHLVDTMGSLAPRLSVIEQIAGESMSGAETDLERLSERLAVAEMAVALAGSDRDIESLAGNLEHGLSTEGNEAWDSLVRHLEAIDGGLEMLGPLGRPIRDHESDYLIDMATKTRSLLGALNSLDHEASAAGASRRSPVENLGSLLDETEDRHTIAASAAWFVSTAHRLEAWLGPMYQGYGTDWNLVAPTLASVSELRASLSGVRVTRQLDEALLTGPTSPDTPTSGAVAEWAEAVNAHTSMFVQPYQADKAEALSAMRPQAVPNTLRHLEETAGAAELWINIRSLLVPMAELGWGSVALRIAREDAATAEAAFKLTLARAQLGLSLSVAAAAL